MNCLKLSKIDPTCAERTSEYQRIIAFRNIVIHRYAELDNRLVWGVVESKLPVLYREVTDLLTSK